MNPLELILMPVTDTEASKWVLPRSLALLRRPNVHVTLFSTTGPGEGPAIKAALEQLEGRLLAEGIACRSVIRPGEPASEILQEAAKGYDLVAMATHGRSGWDLQISGSVALQVLPASPAPMLLFRPLLRLDQSVSAAADSGPERFESILVLLDGSSAAEEILPVVESLAASFRSRVVLFTAIPGGESEEAARRRAAEYLERQAGRFRSKGLATSIEIRAGSAALEAIDVIRSGGISTAALTTHGRSGTAHDRYGSVAEKILQQAMIPLLVVRNRLLRGQEAPAFAPAAQRYELK